MTIPASLRALIESGPLAHVVTVNPDGSPHVTVVWTGWDGDELVTGHMGMTKKLRNLQRDPRSTISVEAPRQPGEFLTRHAVLTTTATVTDGGAWDLLDRLAKTYLGPAETFPAPRAAGGYVIRYRIDRIGGVGPWAAG
jgi:PPOX class probable F420-dependent enzyme